ncbi:MAG TPA: glycosyltransferase family 4 protein [Terracidiphilus sp.]|jgi:glycosyltransferase involved in cell wall biosynthesis|nr:glycosyltransferase family 4 protein [Terracidiphilus sp.]
MGTLEACPLGSFLRFGGFGRPLIVVGVTHPQTCLVLRGRLRSLRAAGFRVVLISSPGELVTRIADEEGVEHCAISMQRGISPLADLISLVRLCFALIRLQPAIAEFSTPKAGLLGSIASFLCRVPVRIYILRGLRLETAAGMTRRILQLCERITAACSHLVVCNSVSLRSQAHALGFVQRGKVRVIGNGSSSGVDVRHFIPPSSPTPDRVRESLGIPAGAPVVGFVGRLTRDKGIPELLDAFDSLQVDFPEARLLLTGWFDDSEDALSPAQRARITNHPRIHCTGFVSDTAPYYHAMDVLALPTLREGFPNAILEAAASGLPAVSTFATGARDAVLHGRTGLLVPPGDPQALAAAVKRLLLSPELRREMGTAARAWVVEHFMHTSVQSLTVALYRSLIRDAEWQPAPALIKDAAAAGD